MTTPNSGPTYAEAALAKIIQGADIVEAFQAAMQVNGLAQQPPTNIVVEFYDNFWHSQGFGGGYQQVQVSFPRLKIPSGSMSLKGDDPLAPLALSCETTLVPVTVQVESLRWAGWVEVAEDKINSDSTESVELQLAGLMTMLDRIMVWPQPELPIEVQPSEAIYIGPGITCLLAMVAEQAFRLQSGWMQFFNTVGSFDLNYQAWFDSQRLPDAEWVYAPIYVPPWDSAEDASVWIAFHGRMDSCWKLMQQQLQDNGWYASLDLWLPGDPQPMQNFLGVESEANLQVASYIFNVKDFSGVSGPSASWVDGAAKELVTLEGSILGTDVIGTVQEYVPPGSNIVISPQFGINYTPPWVIFNADVDQSGLIQMNVAHHAPQAYQLIIGGQSPAWLSAALNATMEYAVDLLTILIGITGIPDDLLNGILDTTFLAFQLFISTVVQQGMGPYAPAEKFFPAKSTYDIDMVFEAINALWVARGYPAAQFTFVNGLPYALGRDIFPGAQASLIRRQVLYSDYIDDIVIIDNNDSFARVTVQVGDGKREESPGLIFQRKIVELEEDVNLILLAPPGGGS